MSFKLSTNVLLGEELLLATNQARAADHACHEQERDTPESGIFTGHHLGLYPPRGGRTEISSSTLSGDGKRGS